MHGLASGKPGCFDARMYDIEHGAGKVHESSKIALFLGVRFPNPNEIDIFTLEPLKDFKGN